MILLALLLLVPFSGLDATEEPSASSRGGAIYHLGKSLSGDPISATVGDAGVLLPGTVVPCASCHGPDGLGRPEGGVTSPPVTWRHLTKPYGHRHDDGRVHPPFAPVGLKRAITEGVDPAGNRLDPAMPRFTMADEDLDALVAYLMHLGTEIGPGVTDTSITLGVITPGEGPLAQAGRIVEALLNNRFDEVNAQGGIYGRTIGLRSEAMAADPALAIAAVDRLVEEPVLALLGAVPPQLQTAVAAHVEALAVPLFNIWLPTLEVSGRPMHYSFYLVGGLDQELDSLMDFAEEELQLQRPRTALIGSLSTLRETVEDAITGKATERGWAEPSMLDAPATIGEARKTLQLLSASRVSVVFYIGGGKGLSLLLDVAAGSDSLPHLLVPGSLVGPLPAVPSKLQDRIHLAYPITPTDWEAGHLRALEALRARSGTAKGHVFSEVAAYATAAVVVEGLRSAGRELTRDRLIEAIEDLYRFKTGLTPPLTYGPNRRIGAGRSQIVGAGTREPEVQ